MYINKPLTGSVVRNVHKILNILTTMKILCALTITLLVFIAFSDFAVSTKSVCKSLGVNLTFVLTGCAG